MLLLQESLGARHTSANCMTPTSSFGGTQRFLGAALQQRSGRRRTQVQRQSSLILASLSYDSAAEAAVRPSERVPRTSLRLAIPSKGRMAEDTLSLLEDCQLKIHKPNPRQYTASIAQMPGLEVWLQRGTDVMRKLLYGDVDLGIVGFDTFTEIAGGDPELMVVHDALGFGGCHLGLGVPTTGKFVGIDSLDALRSMPDWTETTPLRVVTGYHSIARRFFEAKGFENVVLLSADGALEAAPLMGSADIILDLVSTGVTLRENNLKEIEGGRILESQGVLVANRRSLREDARLLELVRELIERFEAHLKANKYYSVVANMRGESPQEVAEKICAHPVLRGLQGPTISEVFQPVGSNAASESGRLFSAAICIPKTKLYESINDLRKIGGSGVLVQPMTYIFDEEPVRWRQLLDKLGLGA